MKLSIVCAAALALAASQGAFASGAELAKPEATQQIQGYYQRSDAERTSCANTYKVSIDESKGWLELQATDMESRLVVHYAVNEGYRKGNKFYEETFRPAYGGNAYTAVVVEFTADGMSVYELAGRKHSDMSLVKGTDCDYEKLN